MSASDFDAVKLISLDILDFKKLQRGKVSWEYRVETKFGVVNVQSFDERTTIFQAIQFGFGHETDVEKAAVTITLQRSNQNEHQIHHFSHFKSARFGHQFKVKIEGIDDQYQLVDQNQYFERLAELKIFASTQTFLLGIGCKDTLATNNMDLRRFLEMHLMHKPNQTNNYDEVQTTLEKLYEQKKTFKQMLLALNKNGKAFKTFSEERSKKAEAVNGEQDLELLQLFYHHKTTEMMREQVENVRDLLSRTPHIQKDHLRDQMRDWTAKMNKNALALDIDINETVLNALSERMQKDVDSIEDELKSLNIATHASIDQFSDVYFRHEQQFHGYVLALDQAKFKLRNAKLHGKISNIEQNWLADQRDSVLDKKVAKDLIGAASLHEDHHLATHLNTIQEEIKKTLGGDSIESKSKVFKILGDQCLGSIRNILIKIPTKGHYIVETDNEDTAERLRTLLHDDRILGRRKITHNCYAFVRPDIEPLIKRVSGSDNKKESMAQFPVASVQKTVDDRMNMEREMLTLIERFKNQRFTDGKKDANVGNDALVNEQELIELEQEVIQAEQILAAQYVEVFGEILKDLGFGDFNDGTLDPNAIINAVNLCTRYQNAFQLIAQNPLPLIDSLQEKLADLEKDRLFIDEKKRNNQARKDSDDLPALNDLLNEGKSIADWIHHFLTHTFGELVILLNEAAVESKLLMVHYLTVKARKLNLSSNTATRLTQAYFDYIGEENRPVIDPNDRSIAKIRDAVTAKIQKIEEVLRYLDHENPNLHYNETTMKKKFQNAQIKMNDEMVKESRQLRNRSTAFETPFNDLLANFDSFAKCCEEQFGMSLHLCYNDPLLEYPIRMTVEDPLLDEAHQRATNLNHYGASLVLQLAINDTIGSPILIVDSLEYMIEPNLISSIMKLLGRMIDNKGIQVLFMQLKPQEEMTAVSSHHMWMEEMGQERITGTTDLLLIDETLQSESRVSFQSASSATPRNSPRQ